MINPLHNSTDEIMATIIELEKEVMRLKLRVEILETFLGTTEELPILNPDRLDEYQTAIDEALVKAGLL